MKAIVRTLKLASALCLLIAFGILGWACASYGPSDAGKVPANAQAMPLHGEDLALLSHDEIELRKALEYQKAKAAYEEAPKIYNEAPVPEGWPALTPVGEVRVKTYPAYRAAFITADQAEGSSRGLFRPLFNHIKREDIAMTAPVEMTFDDKGNENKMAFLYRTPDMGHAGADEKDPRIKIKDVPEQQVASIGVKGGYDAETYNKALKQIKAWLSENKQQWQTAGEPRYLGYNSPFIPSALRYGEVQVPVKPAD